MRRLFFFFCASAVAALAEKPEAAAPDVTKTAPDLRPRIYELAAVLGNDGFKFRDGAWTGSLQDGRARTLPLNLFAGNQYWFASATSETGETPLLSLRDPAGRTVGLARLDKDGIALAGVTAAVTGRYVLEIKGASSGTREFCLLYLFK